MGNLTFGMNIHRSGAPFQSYTPDNLEQNLDSCVQLGMGIIRYNNSCLKGKEAIDEIKGVSKLCHDRGMKLMLVVDTRSYSSMESLEEIEKTMYEHYRWISFELGSLVDYYQVFNEMDVHCMGGDIANIFLTRADGKEKGEYDCVRWERSVAAVKGALRGMNEGYPDAKTCINFAWWHTALIYELYELGLRWDITGIDWYSDCEEVSSVASLMKDVSNHIPECDIMICEVNYWMNLHQRYPEERKQALKIAENRNKWQAEWIPEFIDTLLKIDHPRFKAVMFYELLDEPAYERSEYNGEAHFGFIECDENGENQVRKPAFYSLQKKIKEINNKVSI